MQKKNTHFISLRKAREDKKNSQCPETQEETLSVTGKDTQGERVLGTIFTSSLQDSAAPVERENDVMYILLAQLWTATDILMISWNAVMKL